MPLRFSWLVFQFAATWAFAYLTQQMVKDHAESLPTELRHVALIVWLGRMVIVFALWIAFTQSLVLTIFVPQKAAPMSWFLSPKTAGFIPYGWGLSLAVLSVRFAPGLLRIIDTVGWVWGPLLFLANALFWLK